MSRAGPPLPTPASRGFGVTVSPRFAWAVGGGVVVGLAWAAGLRGFMAEVAGPESTVEWVGTFEGILLPGAVTGALLGWAEHLRRSGDDRFRRRLAAAPLAFLVANPYALVTVVVDGGIGGAALAVPLFGMAGGYALAGRGRRWSRIVAGAVALGGILGWAVAAVFIGGDLALSTPRGAWVATLYGTSLAMLTMACAIPARGAGPPPNAPTSEQVA